MAKAGRKPTGLSRSIIVQVALNSDENEFVARHCFENGLASATYGRLKMLPAGWREKLEALRKAQKYAALNSLDGRRRKG